MNESSSKHRFELMIIFFNPSKTRRKSSPTVRVIPIKTDCADCPVYQRHRSTFTIPTNDPISLKSDTYQRIDKSPFCLVN